MWQFSLFPELDYLPPSPPSATATMVGAFSDYDLPSIESLVRYFHASAGFPTRLTWISVIKGGDYSTLPVLTNTNATNYCPSSDENLKGHITQTWKGVLSTKPNPKSSAKNAATLNPDIGPLPPIY